MHVLEFSMFSSPKRNEKRHTPVLLGTGGRFFLSFICGSPQFGIKNFPLGDTFSFLGYMHFFIREQATELLLFIVFILPRTEDFSIFMQWPSFSFLTMTDVSYTNGTSTRKAEIATFWGQTNGNTAHLAYTTQAHQAITRITKNWTGMAPFVLGLVLKDAMKSDMN